MRQRQKSKVNDYYMTWVTPMKEMHDESGRQLYVLLTYALLQITSNKEGL